MKKLSSLLLLSTFALTVGTYAPVQNVFAQDDAESTEEVVSEESSVEETEAETTESEASEEETEYAFEVETEVINSEEDVLGTAIFREDMEGNVTLVLELEGLEEGEYGMHIHEVGLATAPTFEDAGSHFNPTDVEHGINSETGPHLGDLPNLVVGEDGTVSETIEIEGVTLDPEGENTLNSTDGTTLIIHTGADDYESQPTGDAGDRQAAAVIFAPLEDSEFYQAEEDAESEETTEEETTEETSEESSEEESAE